MSQFVFIKYCPPGGSEMTDGLVVGAPWY